MGCVRACGGELLNGRSSLFTVGSKPQGLNHIAISKDLGSLMAVQNSQKVEKHIIKGKHESHPINVSSLACLKNRARKICDTSLYYEV